MLEKVVMVDGVESNEIQINMHEQKREYEKQAVMKKENINYFYEKKSGIFQGMFGK
jgi:hypothetical protein